MTDTVLEVGISGTTNELGDVETGFQGSVTFHNLQSEVGENCGENVIVSLCIKKKHKLLLLLPFLRVSEMPKKSKC